LGHRGAVGHLLEPAQRVSVHIHDPRSWISRLQFAIRIILPHRHPARVGRRASASRDDCGSRCTSSRAFAENSLAVAVSAAVTMTWPWPGPGSARTVGEEKLR